MEIYLYTIITIVSATAAWIFVQRIARAFSEQHPEFGPHREEGTGCCGGCAGACQRRKQN